KATDRSLTSNLVKHAKKCWGVDVVEARMKGIEVQGRDGDIFAAFARASDHPVQLSDRMLTEAELRVHIVRWVTENHRPLNLVEDREVRLIFSAGRPKFRLPGRRAVSRDLNAAYGRARAHGYNGRLSFSTGAWTSPNHRAFVAWIVHLQHEGELLAFPLDIYEVPEVCETSNWNRSVHKTISHKACTDFLQILAWTGDNASSNDTQNTSLGDSPNNSFEAVNRVHCYNHTLNLSVQAFLHPF
ncbi:hypothetical protein B0H14DRAFT_2264292, partial [Mycena olivaceomarginata]